MWWQLSDFVVFVQTDLFCGVNWQYLVRIDCHQDGASVGLVMKKRKRKKETLVQSNFWRCANAYDSATKPFKLLSMTLETVNNGFLFIYTYIDNIIVISYQQITKYSRLV